MSDEVALAPFTTRESYAANVYSLIKYEFYSYLSVFK